MACIWLKLSDLPTYQGCKGLTRVDARGFSYCPYCGKKLQITDNEQLFKIRNTERNKIIKQVMLSYMTDSNTKEIHKLVTNSSLYDIRCILNQQGIRINKKELLDFYYRLEKELFEDKSNG